MEQKAMSGSLVSVELLNQISNVEEEIATLEVKIQELPVAERDYLHRVAEYKELLPTSKLFVDLPGITTEVIGSDIATSIPQDLHAPWKGKLEPEFVALKEEVIGYSKKITRLPLSSVTDAAQRYQKFVLLGLPGSGKTTCLERLAWQQADSQMQLPRGDCLPLVANVGRLPAFNSVTDWLANTLRDEWKSPLLAENLDWYLQNGYLFLLLDGLNEMGASARHGAVMMLQQFIQVYQTNRIVISSRKHDYDEDLGIQRVEVLPLSANKILEFLSLYLGDTAKAEELYNFLIQENILELGQNPYFLTMMAFVYINNGSVPRNKGRLVQQFVETLYRREQKKSSPDHSIPSEVHQKFVAWLAFDAHAVFGSGAPIRLDWIGQSFPRQLTVKGVSWNIDLQISIKRANDTNLVVIQPGWAQIRFSHQILQEYFAGVELLDKVVSGLVNPADYWQIDMRIKDTREDADHKNEWREHIPPPPPTGWEEPTILAAGCEPEPDNIIYRILPNNPLLSAQCITEGFAAASSECYKNVRERLYQIINDWEASLRARVTAGDLVGSLGDTRLDAEDRMVWIERGDFVMGNDALDYRGNPLPKHYVNVPGFWIDKYPVTYYEYESFVDAGGYDSRECWTDLGWRWKERVRRRQPDFWEDMRQYRNSPVIGISWYEAVAFANWAGKRLLTEAEWEKAASWDRIHQRKMQYPWGDEYNPSRLNINDPDGEIAGRITPIGIYPRGQSTEGVQDLVGNIWEWCNSLYKPYPYDQHDGREELEVSGIRVLRGGTFWSTPEYAMSAGRYSSFCEYRFDVAGFRLAASNI
jgi:formylglycine-generating enzyme required for sulfatase activity